MIPVRLILLVVGGLSLFVFREQIKEKLRT